MISNKEIDNVLDQTSQDTSKVLNNYICVCTGLQAGNVFDKTGERLGALDRQIQEVAQNSAEGVRHFLFD